MNTRRLLIGVLLAVLVATAGCVGNGNVAVTDSTENDTVHAKKVADAIESDGLHVVKLPEEGQKCFIYTDSMGEGGGVGVDCVALNNTSANQTG